MPIIPQNERISEAAWTLEGVWLELENGITDHDYHDTLQEAVYCQTMINRIVWYLNERLNNE